MIKPKILFPKFMRIMLSTLDGCLKKGNYSFKIFSISKVQTTKMVQSA